MHFMYMGSAYEAAAGATIYLYKHRDTRRYLNLDESGNAYAYLPVSSTVLPRRPGSYFKIPLKAAIAAAKGQTAEPCEHRADARTFADGNRHCVKCGAAVVPGH